MRIRERLEIELGRKLTTGSLGTVQLKRVRAPRGWEGQVIVVGLFVLQLGCIARGWVLARRGDGRALWWIGIALLGNIPMRLL